MPRYGYNGRAGVGRSGHAPTAEEPSTVTRKKTPLHHLHQKVGVSIRVVFVNFKYVSVLKGREVGEERERERERKLIYKFVWVRSIAGCWSLYLCWSYVITCTFMSVS